MIEWVAAVAAARGIGKAVDSLAKGIRTAFDVHQHIVLTVKEKQRKEKIKTLLSTASHVNDTKQNAALALETYIKQRKTDGPETGHLAWDNVLATFRLAGSLLVR